MAGTLPAGPLDHLPFGQQTVPFYVLPFDKQGTLQAPATAAKLVAEIASGVTDVVVMVHGWNNDWDAALTLFRGLVHQADDVFTAHGDPRPGSRTIVVGVSWPSIVLSGSDAPAMAAAPVQDVDLAGLSVLGDEVVAPADQAEFYELIQAGHLDEASATRLATLLEPLYASPDDDLAGSGRSGASGPEETVAAWAAAQRRLDDAEGPLVVSGPTGPQIPAVPATGPQAAGLLSMLDPRNVVRLATVLLMKDRAGVVGFRGVGPLLARILGAGADVRVHLVGHSYGCKAVLSAVCSDIPRNVRSVLLLQPALSFLAFSDEVPKLGTPGGYRLAKSRSELPIMATWSHHDIPLHDLFALAVRRSADLGEQNIGAAGQQTPPSLFAAMGGWGAQAAPDVGEQDIRLPADGPYQLAPGSPKVLALNGTAVIGGHSDVVNDATAWALRSLMAQD